MRAAFLLHRRPYRDTSLLLECLVAGEGRMPLIARGAAKGRLKGTLQPFQPLTLRWRGRGEVMTLTHAEAVEKPLDLKKKLLYCGFYLNELLMRLLPRGDACDNLMQVYWKTLLHLQYSEYPDWELRRFELQLLQETGYGVVLDSTCEGEPVSSNTTYSYNIGQGVTRDCSAADALIHGETLLALHQGEWRNARERHEAKLLMRRLIDHSLDYKPLKSRELFR
ncbi:MAG: DNA repair protein RecO [Gammaproteobacteria bacterium]|nr:DNA repair protein RecO [Gammaproteobacteria bacterium]